MNRHLPASRIALLTAALLMLNACQKKDEAAPAPAAAAPVVSPAPAPAQQALSAASLRVVDSAGKTLLTLKPDEMEATFGTGDDARTLRAELDSAKGEDSKRKYVRPGAGVVMEVKSAEDGFKLRNRDGRLLWKVKLKDKGIKISDNEENTKPITLKRKDGNVEVADNGKPLGEASFDGDKARTKLDDAGGKAVAIVASGRASAAFALALATRIPESERAVLALELLARGL